MTTQTEALKLALVALDIVKIHYTQNRHVNEAITAIKEALAQPEQEHEVLGFNGWGFPIEKPNKALIEKTADHDVDCLCIDCSMVDEQDDVPWTDKAFERLCENWNNMTSAEFAIVQRFLFGVYAHPSVPTAQSKEPEQEPAWYHAECNDPDHSGFFKEAIDAVTQVNEHGGFVTKLYTTPPQRKPLLASDIVTMYEENPRCDADMVEFARAIEAAHGIKGEK